MTSHLKACPKCGKLCKGAGLNGHLRFAHRLDEDQVSSLSASAKSAGPAVPKATRSDNPLLRLVDELTEVQTRKAALKAMTSNVLIGRNPTADKALEMLESMEKGISKKLDEMKRQKDFSQSALDILVAGADLLLGKGFPK